MRGFKDYRETAPSSVDADIAAADKAIGEKGDSGPFKDIDGFVNAIIDPWIKDLKSTVLNAHTPRANRRGMWDRFKNWMSNAYYGRYNAGNPYFWNNKLGDDLGQNVPKEWAEAINPKSWSVEFYRDLKEVCESMPINEEGPPPGTENLRLSRIIDQKAAVLKALIKNRIEAALKATTAGPTPGAAGPTPGAGPSPVPAGPSATPPDATPPAGPAPAANPDPAHPEPAASEPGTAKHFDAVTPPTTGKKWEELNGQERAMWDSYGGGNDGHHKIDSELNKLDIDRFPWILRIGDPRFEVLSRQAAKGMPGEGKRVKRFSYWYNTLKAQGRLEDAKNPITSWQDLEQRVNQAKAAYNRWKQSRFGKSSEEIEAEKAKAGGEPVAPEVTPTPAAPAPKRSLRDRKAKIRQDDPALAKDAEKMQHTDTNALDRPAHRSAPAAEEPGMPAPAAPAAPKEAQKDEAFPLFKALSDKVMKLKDDEIREMLFNKLTSARNSVPALKRIEKEVEEHLRFDDVDGSAIDLEDDDAFDKFPPPKLDHIVDIYNRKALSKKLMGMPLDERVKYLKTQISSRV